MVPDCRGFRLFVKIIADSDDVRLKIFCPITILYVIVILLSVFWPKTFKDPQRVFHVVMKVSTDEVVKSLDAIMEDFHVVNSSESLKGL